MKQFFAFALLILLGLEGAVAQDMQLKPIVRKPVYFDVSPPLRDMIKQATGPAGTSWKDGVVPNRFEGDEDVPEQEKSFTNADPVRQDQFGTLSTDTIISNFDGLWNGGGFVPPDTHGDVGPNYYFQVVNCSYAIFNKAGNLIFGPFINSSVWNGMPNNDNSGDAVVLYDENADRWLFSQFSLPFSSGPFFQMIAISQTNDPMGSWYRYQYEYSSMNDYPKFGIWPDGYYMSCNFFGWGWEGNGAYAFDRTAMLQGDPDAVMVGFNIPPGAAGFITLYPSDCDGQFPAMGTPNYFGYIKLNSPQKFGLYEFHADFANPSASTFGNLLNLDVAPFNQLQNEIEQMGTTVRLESLDDRFMYRLQYRKFADHESMVVNHTVSAGADRAGIRWYELRKTTGPWSIYQQATYAPEDDNSRWMGSIAMDTAGSIAMGYSVSGPNLYPSIAYTGRHKTDALNLMTISERTIIPGGGCQTGIWSGRSRWGDYSALSIDPGAPTTFWFTTEYYAYSGSSNWITRIAGFTFDNLFSSSASATPTNICEGDSVQLQASAYGGSGNFTYSWTSVPPGFTSNLQAPIVSPTDTTLYIVTVSDGTQTDVDTAWVNVVPGPDGSAGNDTVICSWLSAVDLTGWATNYKHTVWGSLGDGTFSDRYSLTTVYHPGPQDRANGGADLKLVIFAKSPCNGKIFKDKHITIDACTGTETPGTPANMLTVVPNPARDKVSVTVTMPSGVTGELTLTSMDGHVARNMQVHSQGQPVVQEIDLSGIARGIYVVRLKTDGQVSTQRLIVQ